MLFRARKGANLSDSREICSSCASGRPQNFKVGSSVDGGRRTAAPSGVGVVADGDLVVTITVAVTAGTGSGAIKLWGALCLDRSHPQSASKRNGRRRATGGFYSFFSSASGLKDEGGSSPSATAAGAARLSTAARARWT